MHLDIYNTHMELYPYKKDDYPALEDLYTATDKFTGNQFPCGYMIEDGKLFLPRGTQVSRIENMCNVKAKYITDIDPISKMERTHYSLYDPRDKIQEESVNFLQENNPQAALNLQTGLGKAQPNSTKIPTPNGYKLMGDIKIGDTIFGRNGKPIKVLDVFPQPEELDIYKITFNDGREARCCKNHLWNIWFKNNWQTFKMDDIIRLFNNGAKIMIPEMTGPVIYPNNNFISDPYDVGNLISSELQWETKESYIDKYPLFWNRYVFNSINVRIYFLKGLLMKYAKVVWEGCITKYKYLKYITSNNTIVKIIKEICLSLGYECNIKYYTDMCYEIDLNLPYSLISYIMQIHLSEDVNCDFNINFDENRSLRIINIELLEEKDSCTCIKVDAEDQLYLTEDYIVTHNTFCVAYASTKLSEKTLIITPNESLKQQWINTYSKMFDYRNKQLMNIAGSNIIESIMDDLVDEADVYFVNHQTLRSYMSQYNGYKLHQFFKKLNIGIKVYDESHMEFGNILLIDFFSNTNRTWYLTATFDRSDKTESQCFKRAFNSVITYGEMESQEVVEKHVVYHVVNINSMISPKDRAKLMNSYQGFTAANYGKYAFNNDQNNTMYKTILLLLEKLKEVEGKTLIFVPLIENVDKVVENLRKDFTDKSVAAYHSKCSADEKESAEKKDIIVSTIKSCGTGKDIKSLRCVICAEPFASKVLAQQLMGRLRPYAKDKETYFFDILDISIPAINWWFRARNKKYQELCKKTVYLNMDK